MTHSKPPVPVEGHATRPLRNYRLGTPSMSKFQLAQLNRLQLMAEVHAEVPSIRLSSISAPHLGAVDLGTLTNEQLVSMILSYRDECRGW